MKTCHHIVVSALLQGLGQFTQQAQGLLGSALAPTIPWTTTLFTPWESTLTALLGQVEAPNDFMTLLSPSTCPLTPLQNLLAHASEIASPAMPIQTKPNVHRFQSIFSSFKAGNPSFHKLEPLRFGVGLEQIRKNLFPFLNLYKESHSHCAQLYAECQTEWTMLLQDAHSTSHIQFFLPRLLKLLERYTWCLPLHDRHDISLYDHSLVTAACAQALYFYHLEQAEFPQEYDTTERCRSKFLLIGAKLSTIQDYLFRDPNLGAHNLRARSFYLQHMMETLAQKFLHALQLLPVAKLIHAGGGFCLIAPNLPRVRETLHTLHSEVEHWLYENFFGHLTLALSHIEVSAQSLIDNFLAVYDQVEHTLVTHQLQSFSQTGPHYHWQLPTWELPSLHFEEWGYKLAHSMGFQYTLESADCYFFNDQGLQLFDIPPDNALSYWFQDFKPHQEKLSVKEGIHYTMIHEVPKKETGEMISFEELEQQGSKKDKDHSLPSLAFLKINVDHLTLTLNTAWQTPGLSQWTNFSRMLELFFTGVLPELLKEKFKDIYPVYATGDEALFIGPWRDIIFLSLKTYHLFEKWCCKHPHLTLSGGIVMTRASSSLYLAQQRVDAALQKSKIYRNAQGQIVKNAITLFDTSLPWQELEKLLSKQGHAERLNAYLRDEHSSITPNMIRRLLTYHAMWQNMHEQGNLRGGLWKSKLCYDVARHCGHSERGRTTLRKEGHFIIEQLMAEEAMDHVKIPLLYALLRNYSSKKINHV